MNAAVAVSAPGKVLLAGGYLVLDREYTGLVFGLDARIHVVVQPHPEGTDAAWGGILVRSPQFKDGEWSHEVEYTADGSIRVRQRLNTPYVADSALAPRDPAFPVSSHVCARLLTLARCRSSFIDDGKLVR